MFAVPLPWIGQFGLGASVLCALVLVIANRAISGRVHFSAYLLFWIAFATVIFPGLLLVLTRGASLTESDLLDEFRVSFGAGGYALHGPALGRLSALQWAGGWAALAGVVILGTQRNGDRSCCGVTSPQCRGGLASLGFGLPWLYLVLVEPALFFSLTRPGATGVSFGDSYVLEIVHAPSLVGVAGFIGAGTAGLLWLRRLHLPLALAGGCGALLALFAVAQRLGPIPAIALGLTAGTIVVVTEAIFSRIGTADPGGAIGVHGVCGAIGILFAGICPPPAGRIALASQAIGLALCFAWVYLGCATFFFLLRLTPLAERVQQRALRLSLVGMTLSVIVVGLPLGWFSFVASRLSQEKVVLRELAKFGADPEYRGGTIISLSLSKSRLGDEHLESLGRLSNLEALDLSRTRVTDDGLAQLVVLKHLKVLNLDDSQISDAGLSHLEKMSHLEQVCLEGTRCTRVGVQQLAKAIPRLRIAFDKSLASEIIRLRGEVRVDSDLAKKLEPGRFEDRETVPLDRLLRDNDSSGEIDVDKFVKEVDLHNRPVADADLENLKDLPALESLRLYRTIVTDAGLQHIAHISTLKNLSLNETRIGDLGLKHLSGLTNLEELSLAKTKVTDEGLKHLAGLANLRSLSLQGTRVSDAGLIHIDGLTNLSHLGLQRTDCTYDGTIHFLTVMQKRTFLDALDTLNVARLNEDGKVVELRLYDLPGAEEAVSQCGDLEALEKLRLKDSQVTDAHLEKIRQCSRLREINLGSTPISDKGLENLAGLVALETLQLQNTRITGAGLSHLVGLENLRTLTLGGTDIDNESLGSLKSLVRLNLLDLRDTAITDAALIDVAKVTSLAWLSLDKTMITGSGLMYLQGLVNLRRLSLAGTAITGPGLEDLKGLRNLTDLDLAGTQITDAGLEHVVTLIRLENLNLSSTKVTGLGIPTLARLPSLGFVHLAETEVSENGATSLEGSLPVEHATVWWSPVPASPEVRNAIQDLKDLRSASYTCDRQRRVESVRLRELGDTRDEVFEKLRVINPARLDLRSSDVADADLARLTGLERLVHLGLDETDVTNAGLQHLKELANLRTLDLRLTLVTIDGVQSIRKAIPQLEVDW